MAIDRGSTATASAWHFVWWTQCPRFAGDRQLVRRSSSPQNGRWRTWSSPHWCDKWSTLAVLSCQFDSSVITNHLITLYDHLFDHQIWFSPRFIRFLGKNISYYCLDDCLAHDNFVNSWPFPQRFLVLVFTYPHPNLDIQPIVAVTCPECIGLHASDTPCPALCGHLPYLTFSTL